MEYLVREEGTEALVELIGSYADGVTDDEAFLAAVGRDVTGFEAAWLEDLGADTPTRYGPGPAPAGPLPPGWDEAAATAPPGATTSPATSPAPSATADPGGDGSAGESPFLQGGVLIVAALAGLLVGGSIAYVRRRRGAGGPPGEAP